MNIARFDRLQEVANNDPEFRIAARFWNSTLRLEMGETVLGEHSREVCRVGATDQRGEISDHDRPRAFPHE